ncbi:MAG: toprim domain-containing protein [Candidatus Bathyarchaeota archaeon]|nr:toprim domain-containing protein [Candidatus Bathyarchaeota archaeon]
MSTRLREKEEKIIQILQELTEESSKGKPIIVEGKKDVETLRGLGLTGIIVTVKSGGKSFIDAVQEIEELQAREVFLFLDFDRRGKEATKRLKQGLEHMKIKANLKFWQELSALVNKEIQCIESLAAYLETLHSRVAAQSFNLRKLAENTG